MPNKSYVALMCFIYCVMLRVSPEKMTTGVSNLTNKKLMKVVEWLEGNTSFAIAIQPEV